ncbi:MAG: metallophosphoesterase [Planctomycetota bacterium]
MGGLVLISDVHGNIDALEAVAADIEAGPAPDEIVCLGDLIGYCPASNEVIELLRSIEERYSIRYNLGSHDAAALGRYQFVDLTNDDDITMLRAAGLQNEAAVIEEYFKIAERRFVPVRTTARDSINWTLEHLSGEAVEFLRERLVETLEIEPGTISVHGSPRDQLCEYVRESKIARKVFESHEMDGVWLCFVGHTHLPVVWRIARKNLLEMAGSRVCMGQPEVDRSKRVELDRADFCYIVNVGAVGQPRDRDPRACYARYSPDEHVVEHIRVEYDIDAAAARVREAGFAERIAERLYQGE